MRMLALTLALLFSATAAHAVDLTIRFDGVEDRGGSVRVGLFDSAEAFEQRQDGVVAKQTVKADGDSVVVRFEDLVPGRYAVTAFHDANENRHLDKVLGVVPSEGVALSNDPALLASPGFEDMAIDVTMNREIEVRFRYLGS